MSAPHFAACVIGALLIAGCGTVEDNSWTYGIPREEAMEISRAMRASLGIHKIYSFARLDGGDISVSTDRGIYTAHRAGHTWKFTKEIFVAFQRAGLTMPCSQQRKV